MTFSSPSRSRTLLPSTLLIASLLLAQTAAAQIGQVSVADPTMGPPVQGSGTFPDSVGGAISIERSDGKLVHLWTVSGYTIYNRYSRTWAAVSDGSGTPETAAHELGAAVDSWSSNGRIGLFWTSSEGCAHSMAVCVYQRSLVLLDLFTLTPTILETITSRSNLNTSVAQRTKVQRTTDGFAALSWVRNPGQPNEQTLFRLDDEGRLLSKSVLGDLPKPDAIVTRGSEVLEIYGTTSGALFALPLESNKEPIDLRASSRIQSVVLQDEHGFLLFGWDFADEHYARAYDLNAAPLTSFIRLGLNDFDVLRDNDGFIIFNHSGSSFSDQRIDLRSEKTGPVISVHEDPSIFGMTYAFGKYWLFRSSGDNLPGNPVRVYVRPMAHRDDLSGESGKELSRRALYQETPDVVFSDGVFATAFAESPGSAVRLARVTPAGQRLDGPGVLLPLLSSRDAAPRVAAIGSSFLVVSNSAAATASFAHDRVEVTSTKLPEGRYEAARGNGTDFLTVSISAGQLQGVRLAADGRLLEGGAFPIIPSSGEQSRPRLAWNGSEYGMVYDQTCDDGVHELMMVRLRRDGRPDSVPLVVSPCSSSLLLVDHDVTWGNGEWVIVWSTHDHLPKNSLHAATVAPTSSEVTVADESKLSGIGRRGLFDGRDFVVLRLFNRGGTYVLAWVASTQIAACETCSYQSEVYVSTLPLTPNSVGDSSLVSHGSDRSLEAAISENGLLAIAQSNLRNDLVEGFWARTVLRLFTPRRRGVRR